MDETTGSFIQFQKLITFYVQVIALTTMRFWGVFFIFPIFIWANVPPMITMVWAFCFALPALPAMMSVLFESNIFAWPITSASLNASEALSVLERKQVTLINLKEFCLGALLGFFPAAFFYGFIIIGEVIDQARGDIGGKSSSGGSLEMTSCGTILFLVGSILFFASQEFLHFITLIYRSYEVWPLYEISGFLTFQRMYFFLELSMQLMFSTIYMALPFLILMWAFDVQSLYQTKMDKKFQGQDYQPALKNALFILFFIFYLNYTDNAQYNPTLTISSNFSAVLEAGNHSTGFQDVR